MQDEIVKGENGGEKDKIGDGEQSKKAGKGGEK